MQSSGPVAQGIEHRIPNPGVAGSNPAGITKFNVHFPEGLLPHRLDLLPAKRFHP